MTGFNVNCRDCIYIAWNKKVGYYCSYPYGVNEIVVIKDIEQNIDCLEYEGPRQLTKEALQDL